MSSAASQVSIFFTACEDSYNKVFGQLRGFQFWSPSSFLSYNYNSNIDAFYVDGIFIIYDSNPRKLFFNVHVYCQYIIIIIYKYK